MDKYKSVLEGYNEDRKPRLPTAEEEAVEGVYPEELLIGGGAGKALKSVAGKLKDKAEVFMRPKVKNSIYPETPGGKPSGQYAVRNVRGPEELEAIKKSGYMLPKEGGKQQKYFTQTDNMRTESNAFKDNSVLRVPIEKVPPNRAVSRNDVEKYNLDTGKFEPLKKGGKVKSKASSRGDGIAQRGKTRGRMV
jgi:hypothetical protein